jgi:site-specific DNA recombinase
VSFDGYIRVSRVGGRDGDSYRSPHDQREAIERLAAAHGLALGEVVLEEDVSGGKKAEQRGLERLVRKVESGESEGLLVWRVSRLSRNLADGAVVAERVGQAGGRLIGEDLDTAQPMGKALMGFLLGWAEEELDQRRAGFARAVGGAIERGAYVSAVPPLGYTRVNQRLVAVPEEARMVRGLFERRAGGASWTELARWMDSQGRPMSRSGLKALMENEAYLGVARNGGFRNEGAHEAIVGRALFEQANAARGLRPVHNGALSSVAMLRSLCRCATCGGTMTVTWTRGARVPATGERTKLPAYACRGDSARGRCPARAYVRVDQLDPFVEAHVLGAFEGEGPLAEAVASSEALDAAALALDEASHAVREVLASPRLVAALGADEFAALVENAKAEEARARREYAEARNRSRAVGGFRGAMLEVWPTLTPGEKRELLGGFVERVVVRAARGQRGLPLERRVQVVFAGNVVLDEPDGDARVPSTEEGQPSLIDGLPDARR